MKRLLMSFIIVGIASLLAIGATTAYFSDTEVSSANTFTAGVLDLQVDGQDQLVPIIISNLIPGQSRGSQTFTITNVGDIPGRLTWVIKNVVSEEDSVLEPEEDRGDGVGLRLDPDGYTIATSGAGELLDQVMFRFWVDDTPGQRPANFDWQDIRIWDGYPDESSYYSLPVNTDIAFDNSVVLDPGETMYLGVTTSFIDDINVPYGWILDGVSNSAAMNDSVIFDMEVGLTQVSI